MKVVKNWKKALRSYSAMALAFAVAAPMVWAELPPEVVAMIPEEWQTYIYRAVLVLGLIGRFIKQGKEDGVH